MSQNPSSRFINPLKDMMGKLDLDSVILHLDEEIMAMRLKGATFQEHAKDAAEKIWPIMQPGVDAIEDINLSAKAAGGSFHPRDICPKKGEYITSSVRDSFPYGECRTIHFLAGSLLANMGHDLSLLRCNVAHDRGVSEGHMALLLHPTKDHGAMTVQLNRKGDGFEMRELSNEQYQKLQKAPSRLTFRKDAAGGLVME